MKVRPRQHILNRGIIGSRAYDAKEAIENRIIAAIDLKHNPRELLKYLDYEGLIVRKGPIPEVEK